MFRIITEAGQGQMDYYDYVSARASMLAGSGIAFEHEFYLVSGKKITGVNLRHFDDWAGTALRYHTMDKP